MFLEARQARQTRQAHKNDPFGGRKESVGKKDEIKSKNIKIQTLSGHLADAKNKNKKLEDRVNELETENKKLEDEITKIKNLFLRARFEKEELLLEISQLKKKLLEARAPEKTSARKIGHWNIVKSGGYYRAFRRINGKLHAIHLGKDLRRAAKKIEQKESDLANDVK